MLGKQNIEKILLKNYSKTTFPILSIILIIYILNVNNHYKLFLERYERLERDSKYYQHNYQIYQRLIKKILKNANFVGRKLLISAPYLSGNNHVIVIIKSSRDNGSGIANIAKIINKIKEEKPDVNIFTFSNNQLMNMEKSDITYDGQILIELPALFLIDGQMNVLGVFSIDGTESIEEVQLISEYILENIKK
ncbi:MAG: hypothetical protein QXP04_05030 [Candidatus Nanoarchaeia archaeon]|nr:hypothetical protein [Candidatus Jingweiarchaeum tengchongense]